jgi:hypothetical protein
MRDATAKLLLFIAAGIIEARFPESSVSTLPTVLLFVSMEEVARALPVRSGTSTPFSTYVILGMMIGTMEGATAGTVSGAIDNSICHSCYGVMYEAVRRTRGERMSAVGVLIPIVLHLFWNLTVTKISYWPIPQVLMVMLVTSVVLLWMKRKRSGTSPTAGPVDVPISS